MATFDAVFVGSGINSLVGAALLARDGWSVCVLERNDVAGGCIRTSTDLTLPGFTHEVLASWHPLFTGSAAYAELKDELDRRGVTYVNTDLPTGTAFPDGSAAFITGSLEGNVAEFDRLAPGDGAAWERQFNAFMANADLSFGILSTELWSAAGLSLGRKALRRLGRRGLLEFAGHTLVSCRDWVSATFQSDAARGVLAPWVLHTGLGPDQATSGFMTQVIGAALQLGGMPVPVGGGVRLVDALVGIVTDAGGEVRLDADVRRIMVANGRATGVRLDDGEIVAATRAVVANVTPTQLYGKLLGGSEVPAPVAECGGAVPLRPGRDADPPRARRAASLEGTGVRTPRSLSDRPRHTGSRRRLARGQRGRTRVAARRGDDRLRPAGGARPVARSGGKSLLWIQLQELPAGTVKGDAAGELDTGDGTWTEELREAYADRVVARLGESIENLGASTLKRVVVSPADLEALNANLVGGDIYGGSCALDQNLLWRPLAGRSRSRDGCRGALAHRREHPPRAGARGRLRLPRREGADAGRRSPGGCLREFPDARDSLAVPDLHGRHIVRRRGRGIRGCRVRRHRALGVQAARGRRREHRPPARPRAAGRRLRPAGAVGASARDSGNGRA